MPAYVNSRPAAVQWAITNGDDVALTLTSDDDLSVYTFEAKILTNGGAEQVACSVDQAGTSSEPVVVSLTDAQTVGLVSGRWYVRASDRDWTLIDGPFVVAARGSAGVGSPSTTVPVVFTDQTLNLTLTPVAGVGGGGGGGGAPTDATYLVTTANGDLSNEVVVGATPGGELGGTWASPTVDATHSGSSHAAVQAAAEATAAGALASHEADTTNVHGITNTASLETTTGAQAKVDTHVNDTSAAHTASAISADSTTLAGTGADVQAVLEELDDAIALKANTSSAVMDGDTAGGVLGGTYPNPSFAADMATQAELDAHTGDSSAAHAASAISFSPTGNLASTDAQAAIAEAATDAASALSTHEADTTSVHGISDTSALVTTSSVTELAQDAVGAMVDTDGSVGDIVFTYSDATPKLSAVTQDGTVTYAKIQDVSATSRVLGRITSGSGDVEELTPANLVTLVNTADGTGSGLDADLLDGVHAAALLKLVANGDSVENIGAVEWNVNTVATSGSTETLDTSVYGTHDVTMDQACTFTFSNPAPSGKETEFKLILRGAFTPTFPAAVDWGDATPPTYTTPSVYIFSTVDAGTTWLGSQVGKAFG